MRHARRPFIQRVVDAAAGGDIVLAVTGGAEALDNFAQRLIDAAHGAGRLFAKDEADILQFALGARLGLDAQMPEQISGQAGDAGNHGHGQQGQGPAGAQARKMAHGPGLARAAAHRRGDDLAAAHLRLDPVLVILDPMGTPPIEVAHRPELVIRG